MSLFVLRVNNRPSFRFLESAFVLVPSVLTILPGLATGNLGCTHIQYINHTYILSSVADHSTEVLYNVGHIPNM